MINTILATKKRMIQAWTEDGKRVPITIIQAGPVVVTQIKTQEKDGYEALQLGFEERKIKNITKPMRGHLQKLKTGKNTKLPRFLREVKIQQTTTNKQQPKIGDIIKASDVLSPGDLVKVTGISKGKGFAGVVKRWHFAGGPRTHGQSDRERAPGSIGATTTPGRVLRGKKMAGRMGAETATVRNLTVLEIGKDGEVKLSGLVPGNPGGLLSIEKIGKNEKFSPLVTRGEEIHPEELPSIKLSEEDKENEEGKEQNAERVPSEQNTERAQSQ
ncbi:50S ribosomal protein L3 [Candidatus Microgenomates bacterium]|nr:50S ribosomal protein L3 [Candidatus Microgenomates bacterium]